MEDASAAAPDPSPAPESLVLPIDQDGLAWLSLRQGDAGDGTLTERLLWGMERLLGELEALAEQGRARAVIVQGFDPPFTFLGGTDLEELERLPDAEAGAAWALHGQRVLRRLEDLPVPTVAAVDGLCRGAGLEIALACGYRIASDSGRTRLGLPEVRGGLIPALGGTVRLPRLIGLQASLELILSGRLVSAEEAARIGLVDGVVPAQQLTDGVRRFARERVERGRIRTGARRRVPRRLLEDTAPGRRLIFSRAARRFGAAGDRGSPAKQLALQSVADGVALPLSRAFEREAEVFGQLLASPRSRALVHSGRLLQEARLAPAGNGSPPVEQAAVLGAGEEGSQWAYLLARAGVRVRLRHPSRASAAAALKTAAAHLTRDAESGRLTRSDALERSALLTATSGYGGFGTLDLVVAVAGSDERALATGLREAEGHTLEETVFVSTSTLVEVTTLQRESSRPEQMVGLHLSLPADTFPLAEIVAGEQTTEHAMHLATHLAWRLGRTPIRVADRPGGLADRLLAAYLSEATHLLEEGIAPERVDEVAVRFGMVMGPCRRMDVIGVERASRLLDVLAGRLGERMRPARVLERVVESGAGVFRYRGGQVAGANRVLPGADRKRARVDEAPIRDRLFLRLVNEAAHAVGESVASPSAVDLAAILGLGFPRERGGLLYHADQLTAAAIVAALEEASRLLGDRFAPAPLLQRAADQGGLLHRAALPSGQA